MDMVEISSYSMILFVAAFLAGLIDAVVGGGGLIQLPALFSFYPNAAAATLFGTNKLAGLCGTSFAAIHYANKVRLRRRAILPAAAAAFPFAFLGAYTVTHIPSDLVRKVLPFILVLVAIYTFKKKGLGENHAPLHSGVKEMGIALVVGACVGFYDGFFGPGTGSFLVFMFVRVFGLDFLGASASAKVVNVVCNFAALLWFGYAGHVLWKIGAIMALLNVAGSLVGSFLAIRHGSGFVRKAFLLVICMLILKTGHDAFFVQ